MRALIHRWVLVPLAKAGIRACDFILDALRLDRETGQPLPPERDPRRPSWAREMWRQAKGGR